MRISDWSSDVCSSDLAFHVALENRGMDVARLADGGRVSEPLGHDLGALVDPHAPFPLALAGIDLGQRRDRVQGSRQIGRASCRERVFSTCRSRWAPYH